MEFVKIEGEAADSLAAYSNLKRRWARIEAQREATDTKRLEALREAQERGLSLRHMASATGLSHQRIHQLLAKES